MKATRWKDLEFEDVRPGVRRAGFGTEEMLLVMNVCEPGMQPKPHSHDFDQIAMIISGTAIYHVGDVDNEVGPGSVVLAPAGVEHWIEPTGEQPVENIDVFAPARADYAHLLKWMQGD